MSLSEPTITSILLDLAREYDGVVAEREVFARVLERRPSSAKDPYASIRNLLRYDSFETGWVRLGGGKLIPRHSALRGLRFRVVPAPDEITADLLARAKLEPFVKLRMPNPQLLDAAGAPIASQTSRLPSAAPGFNFSAVDAQTLDGWYARAGFVPGDSILIAIVATDPLTLELEREPANQFRAETVAAQERELIAAIAERVERDRSTLIPADTVVLPIYAQAAWRTAYPGRPWQQLVQADRRLRLLDDMYLADHSFRRPLDFLVESDEQSLEAWAAEDQDLFDQIHAFQSELLSSRREAAASGIWNGIAPRASTGQVIYDVQAGTSQVIHPGLINALDEHTEAIEQRVERGDFADVDWDELDDELGELAFDESDPDDLLDIDDIEDMQNFMDQNPALVEATHKLMASLSADELAALNDAETPDQVQMILTKHLNMLLGRERALFDELTPELVVRPNGQSEPGPSDNGQHYSADDVLSIEREDDWESDDGEEWEDDDEDEMSEAVERSNDLMERFFQALVAQGKSEATAASRTGDLWIYADFLSSYYDRPLDQGDYATLDECLFFYYPRKVLNNSARAARDMCTSFKQFYAFLRAEGVVASDSFAQAIWRRRDQAARVVELYDRIDPDSPQFERLFAHLFAPYTA